MSSVSQVQLRYITVPTAASLANELTAFPGTLSVALDTKILYEYVEYPSVADKKVADGVQIISLSDNTIPGQWIAVDSFSSKSLSGSFTVGNWHGPVQSTNTYTYTVNFANPVNNFICKVLDNNGAEVYPQEVIVTTSQDGAVGSVTFHVGATPDCRFAGKYFIMKDKLV